MRCSVPDLGPGEVHAWTVPVARAAAADEALAALADDERTRALRFHFEADRARYIAGRYVARTLIAAYGGNLDPATLRFVPGLHGKPDLSGSHELHFNWAHAGDLVVFAITGTAPVGVDVEHTARFADLDAVAARVFSSRELLEYEALRDDARRIAFFNGWTRKEAFIKATGEGMTRGLKTFAVALSPGAAATLHHIEDGSDDVARWTLHAFEPLPGYAAAVAVRAPGITLRLQEWPPAAG